MFMEEKEKEENKMSKIIAVDLGGTNLRVALLREGKILKYMKKNTPKEKNALLRELVDSILQVMGKDVRDVKAIGIASPGPLKNGIIKNPPNIPLKNFNLKKFLEKKFKKRVEIGNDANCVALAEAKLGCKKRNFIILTLGTGIGGGIVINGELYKGEGYGGELGQIILNNGRDLEELWKDSRRLSKKYFGKILLVADLLKLKDKRAKEILEQTSLYLGQGIASLINIFDPEIVILSGGIKETGSVFLNMIKKQVKKYVALPKTTPIKWAGLKHPGILGASLLVK